MASPAGGDRADKAVEFVEVDEDQLLAVPVQGDLAGDAVAPERLDAELE